MLIGAHVSIAGGLTRAVERGVQLGAECLQIFASSPRVWQPPAHDPAEIARFRARLAETGINPVLLHSIYLLNPASPDPALFARSVRSLVLALQWSERLGAQGVITHLGSAMGQHEEQAEERVVRALEAILGEAPPGVRLFLETSAGRTVGGSFAQLGRLIRRLDGDARLGVCLDTAHVFASGYDFRGARGLRAMLDEFECEIGLARLAAVHVNDSKVPLGSGKDRHENIGRGYIGARAFARLLRHPALHQLPFILEVPGLDGNGPDRENIAILRRLAGAGAATAPFPATD